MIRKDVIFAVLATFCLTTILFTVIPVGSYGTYDPWMDLNDDGKIDARDIAPPCANYGATGTPINKTELLLELQSRLDSLNSSVLALQGLESYLQIEVITMRVKYDAKLVELQNKIDELENRLALLESLHNLPINWSNGLVGYWKLDEGSGNITVDSSGNNNNGTLVNNPLWVDGKYGKALSLDGTDDSVAIPDSLSLRIQSFSLEAWIYMTKRPYQHGSPHSTIINKLHYSGPPGTWGYKLQFESPSSTDDNLEIALGDGIDQRHLLRYDSINDLTLGQWHHIVGTYDGTTARLYIDGMLKISTNPGTFYIVHDNAALMLGAEYYYGGCMFNGLIDNAMVYNRSLTETEVMAHYFNPPP